MRVLGRVRLSRSSDESTSVERQREIIQTWADTHGHTVVGWAEDVDVSGSVSPFDAPSLAPWLREPKQNEWDILCAWKLDRVARTSIPLHRLFGWVQDNGKTLVCVADHIDLSNWVGRLVASVIAGVAEGELEAIRERTSASHKKLIESGRWAGGTPPYGWRVAPRDSGGYELERDPVAMPVLQRIIREFLDGSPAGAIADTLTEEGITAPRNHMNGKTGGTWSGTAIRRMLGSKTMLGWAVLNGVPVLDSEGKPVLKAPPAVTQEVYEELQAVLDGRKWARSAPTVTSPFLNVLRCWHCNATMYIRRNSRRTADSYYCSENCTKQISVNSEVATKVIEGFFREMISDIPVIEKQITYASDHSHELSEAHTAYEEISNLLPTAPNAETRANLITQLTTIGKRIGALEALNVEQDSVEWVETGQNYGELWDSLDTEARRQMMIRSGFTFRIEMLTRGSRWGHGDYRAHVHLPTWIGGIRDNIVSGEGLTSDHELPPEVLQELERLNDPDYQPVKGIKILQNAPDRP